MSQAPECECNQNHGLTEHEHTKDIQATDGHNVVSKIPKLDDNCKTAVSSSILALESEQRAFRWEHREPDGNGKPLSIQLLEYRDDRDSAIIHFGTIGTHEGKTFIPKRSVHKNALDDLAHPYDENQDFYVLDVNLDGDQVDHLLQCSAIYDAGGERTDHQQKTADCLLTHL